MTLLSLFKGLADPIRLRIFHLLTQKDELCVCHITDALNLPQSTVSRHLNTLKHAELVAAERRGKWVYYRLHEKHSSTTQIASFVKTLSGNDPQLQRDMENLKVTSC